MTEEPGVFMEKIFELTAESERLAAFRETLRLVLEGTGLTEKAVGEVILAVDEALTNVVRHSYGGGPGKIEVRFRDRADRVEITVRDFGKPFDPSQVPLPDLPPKKAGGLGVYFMKTLMDKVECDAKISKGNLLTLTKYK